MHLFIKMCITQDITGTVRVFELMMNHNLQLKHCAVNLFIYKIVVCFCVCRTRPLYPCNWKILMCQRTTDIITCNLVFCWELLHCCTNLNLAITVACKPLTILLLPTLGYSLLEYILNIANA